MAEHGWDEVKEKFNAALSLSVKERELYLKQLSTESTQLHHEVADLLAQHSQADDNDFMASIQIGKKTEADLAETIAHMLPTLDIKATVDNLNMPTVDLNSLQDKSEYITLRQAAEISEENSIGVIGDYQLIEQIGRGGMGVVYKAYQKSIGRMVALKVIAAGSLSSPEDIARFRDEASAAGRLNHPGIVAIYDAGEHGGNHYFSMAYIEGENLASYVGAGKPQLKPKEAARLMEEVCRAVQYAHDHAVIHRDIKPANIMLDKSGQPLLADFGLAKLIGNENGFTQTGQTMGTPNYMAPEQARGQLDLISTRTDVYSLGGTLYALLRGKPPIEGKNLLDTLKKVESAPPESLYYRGSQVPLDLWTICEKCLAKRPEDRYESAGALADELQRFLHGFPILARAVGPWTRLQRWCQRNPLIATLLGAIAATLVIATIVSIMFAVQARAAQLRAENNVRLIEDILDEVLITMSESDLAEMPGTQFARQKLLTTAQRYYEELSSTQQVSQDVLARAAFPLGRLQASLGQYDDAQKSFDTVLAMQEQIAVDNPNDADASLAVALTHNEYAKLGEKLWNERDLQNPSTSSQEGLAMYLQHEKACHDWRTKALELAPDNPETARLLANAKMGLGNAESEQQKSKSSQATFAVADALLEQSQAIRNKLLNNETVKTKVLPDLAKGYISQAELQSTLAQLSLEASERESHSRQAMELRHQAAEILEQLPPKSTTTDTKYDLAACYQQCGNYHALVEEYEPAIEFYEKMGMTLNPLLLSNPGVYKYRKGVADAQYNLAQLYLVQKDNLGLDYVADFQKTLVNALIVDPRNRDAIDLLVGYSQSIASLIAGRDYFPEAVGCLEQAKTFLNEAKPGAADPAIIEAAIEKLDEEIEAIRENSNESDPTAFFRRGLIFRRIGIFYST
jgi:hypothetical protein